MSSFFTLPASQAKRKRVKDRSSNDRPARRKPSQSKKPRDESISGSDISDDDRAVGDDDEGDASDLDGDDFADEVPSAKRLRLAEQYLANTQREILDEAGFDAADIDAENLATRMGERLKEDTAESKGRLYRWIADDFDWSKAKRTQFRHHQKSVNGAAISGQHIYTVGKDGMLVKWALPDRKMANGGNRVSRKPKKLLVSRKIGARSSHDDEEHTGAILCVAASQDGRFIATGGSDKKLIVWDAESLKPLKTFPQHRDAVTSLAFRRGTNQLFSASKDRTIKTWSLNELTYVETLFGHQDEVVDVSALAEEKCVTVGARDRTARLWKVVEESQLVFRGGGAPSKSKLANRDDMNGTDLSEVERHHEGSTDRVACIDDETFITGSDNGSLSLWNIHKKKPVFVLPLAHGLDPPLPLDEVSAELHPDQTAIGKPTARWITALRAIPFSDTFVTGSWDGYIRAWRITPDKRRIEALGRVGCVEASIEESLRDAGLSSSSISRSALQALEEGSSKYGEAAGVVNDLAIADAGERASDGIIIVAAMGKSHRMGRWMESKDGKNNAILFEVPRKGSSVSEDNDENSLTEPPVVPNGGSKTNGEHDNGDFEGFD